MREGSKIARGFGYILSQFHSRSWTLPPPLSISLLRGSCYRMKNILPSFLLFNPFFLLFKNQTRSERILLEKLDHLCLSQCSHQMEIHSSGSLALQEEKGPV